MIKKVYSIIIKFYGRFIYAKISAFICSDFEQISKLDYNIFEENVSNYIEKCSRYQSYFNDGEKEYKVLHLSKV
ncbi:hypothetical protein [Clostridium diolis]|uniref:hypothetical protein n=1 Tax=Clostridium diolis TaxID=223919 RepID=UPI003AF80D42